MKSLNIEYTPARVRETPAGPRFRIGRIAEIGEAGRNDLSHLVDRSYDYASARELRWHLAERFGLTPDRLVLTRH